MVFTEATSAVVVVQWSFRRALKTLVFSKDLSHGDGREARLLIYVTMGPRILWSQRVANVVRSDRDSGLFRIELIAM